MYDQLNEIRDIINRAKKVKIKHDKSFNRCGRAQAKHAKIKGSLDFTTKLARKVSATHTQMSGKKPVIGKAIASQYHKLKRRKVNASETRIDTAIDTLLHAQQILLAKKVLGLE